MARLAATAVLLLALLAVSNCRVLEAEPEAVVAISDERSQADPAVPQESDAAEVIPSLPTVLVDEGILRLPSHRRPSRRDFVHRHLRWVRHHDLSHRSGDFSSASDAVVIPAFVAEEPREAELEAVAEPDPDTRPDTDGQEKPFHGEEVEGEENESVKAWKGEMLRRFRSHGLRFHHRHHLEHAREKDDIDDHDQHDKAEWVRAMFTDLFSHQFHHLHGNEKEKQEHKEDGAGGMPVKLFSSHFGHHHHSEEDQKQQDKEEGAGDVHLHHVKKFNRRFHHHHGDEEQEQQDKKEGVESLSVKLLTRHFHHRHADEEQEGPTRKHYFHHHHDSDNEVDEIEELARRLSKAIMRRSLRRGGIRHHLHHHHAEEGGVKKWFRGLLNMNMF